MAEEQGVETELRWITKTLERLEKKIDEYQKISIARTEVDALFEMRDNRIRDIRADMDRLENEHIVGLKQDIAGMKQAQIAGAANRPNWWLVAINSSAVIISLVALAMTIISGR